MTAAAAARPVAEQEVRALLGPFLRDGRSRLLVLDAAPTWDGPEVLETDDGEVRVVTAGSVLAARCALVDHAEERLVLLTDQPQRTLGDELLAQAYKNRAHRPTPWDALASLFRADRLDPELRTADNRWMVQFLVARAPAGGYPAPAGGVVDVELAWREVRRLLDVPQGTSAMALLDWVVAGTAHARLGPLDADVVDAISERLGREVTPVVPHLVRLARRDAGDDAVPLGLVVDALWPAPGDRSRALLEADHLDRVAPDETAALRWAELARGALDIVDPSVTDRWIERAEELIRDVDGTSTADSDLLPSVAERRIRRVAELLRRDLEAARASEGLDEAIDALARHRTIADDRVDIVDHARRVLRRGLATPVVDELVSAVEDYRADGAYLDAAIDRLAAGDSDAELGGALHAVRDAAIDHAWERDRAFASVVADAAAAPVDDRGSLRQAQPLRIEQVLDAVVTPLAADGPVLLLVIDGLSHASAIRVLGDLRERGWIPHGPGGERPPAVLAAFPTRTNVSRSSLLCGRLVTGEQDVEREGFATHAGLVEASSGGEPVLFHRAALGYDEGQIAGPAREALANPDQQVVGIVFNGVDDFLGANGQLTPAAGLDGLPLLPQLLGAALGGGRTVILTSDHGHILTGATAKHGPGGGERYRPADGDPADEHEIVLSGGRVLDGGGRIVAAADGAYRYVNFDKRGYHGGATPAETLCPLHVLVPTAHPRDGWEALPVETPEWWDPTSAPVDVEDVATSSVDARSDLRDPDGPPSLFDEVEGDWIEELLRSSQLRAQRALVPRAPDDDAVAAVLRVLAATHWRASAATLQRSLGVSPTRLRSRLEPVRAVLSVDGYAVLTIEPDGSARLDRELLAAQFDVDVPARGA